jgi:AcrR family transcriptional regulator
VSSRAQPRTRRLDRRTREARSERRDGRAALLDAAAEVFAARGLRDASVDEVAERAGYSKGAVYWHFESKDDLFLALLEERIDQPMREMIGLLESAPPEQDMGPEASRRFTELLASQRELLLLEHEYWSQAARDPALHGRYRDRQARLRAALGKALITRLEHLGAPALELAGGEAMATIVMALAAGLARERLIDPDAVPDDLLGNALVLLYRGTAAKAH